MNSQSRVGSESNHLVPIKIAGISQDYIYIIGPLLFMALINL